MRTRRAGRMNQLEARYEARVIRPRLLAGEVLSYRFEPLKLRIAPKTYYTPDFLVITQEAIEFHEVKGHWEDDARVKIKAVAELHPWFAFVAVTFDQKSGVWKYEHFDS